MKKIYKSLILIAAMVFSSIAFAACGFNKEIKSIYVDLEGEESILVQHKSEWDPKEEIVIKAKLSDDSEISIDADDCEFSDVDTDVVGRQTLTVTYNTYECEVFVDVYAYISSIEVVENSLPKNVLHNSNNGVYDTTGARIRVNYSDLTYEEVTEGFTITPGNTTEVGEHSVTVTYNGVEVNYTYNVTKTITAMEVIGTYSKQFKWSATNEYDYSGVRASVTYSDNTTAEIANADLTIVESSKIKTNQKGEQKFTVSYGGATAESETVTVYTEYESLVYVSGLTDFEYGTDLSTKNIVVKAVYTDGAEVEITTGLTYNYNRTVVGDNIPVTISATIGGVTKTTEAQNVNIFELAKALVVEYKTVESRYAIVSENINKDKFNFFIQYTKNKVAIQDVNNITVTPETSQTVGNVNVEFTYTLAGVGTPFTVTKEIEFIETWDEVPAVEISSIAIKSGLQSTVNHNGTLDLSDLVVDVTYSNGAVLSLDYSEYSDEMEFTFNSTQVGNQTFTLTYEGKTATATIEVVKTYVSAEVVGLNTSYLFGVNYFDGVKVVATYSDNTTENITVYSTNIKSANEIKADLNANHITTYNLTFTFSVKGENKTCTASLEIYEEVQSLTVSGVPSVVNYGSSSLLNNMVVTVAYTSGNTRTLSNTEYEIVSSINTNILGNTQYLKVEFTETIKNQKTVTNDNFYVEVKDYIVGYELVGLNTSYRSREVIDYSQIALKPVYVAGSTPAGNEYIRQADLIYEEILMTTGNHTFTATSKTDSTITASFDVMIVEYVVAMINTPNSLKEYRINSQKLNTYNSETKEGTKGFSDVGNMYVVGDDNGFKFSPEVRVFYDESSSAEKLDEYVLNAKVYLFENSNYTELTGDRFNRYVSFDNLKHEFDFTDSAIGKQFKLWVQVDYLGVGEDRYTEQSSYEIEVKVIDGYNAYNAADLSLIDNSHTLYAGTSTGTKWNEIKQANGIDLNITTNAVILHNNISVTRNDIPSIHFLTEEELRKGGAYSQDEIGSLKNSDGQTVEDGTLATHYIYLRTIKNGETFNLEGNYFQIDMKDIPLTTRNYDYDGLLDIGKRPSDDAGISVNTKAIGFASYIYRHGTGAANEKSTGAAEINNIEVYGNSKKQGDVSLSGGISFFESKCISLTVYNSLAQALYMFGQFSNEHDFATSYKNGDGERVYVADGHLKKVNAYDSYNTLIYLYGIERVFMDSCNLIGAGGPVMICDHADVTDDHPGYVTNVYVDQNLKEYGYTNKSVLESWVVGTEGWFTTYGAGSTVGMLQTLQVLIDQVNQHILLDRTIQKTGNYGGTEVTFINLVAAYKSTGYGMTTGNFKGSFNVYGYDTTGTEIEEKGHMNFDDEQIVKAKSDHKAGVCIIQTHNTEGQSIAVPQMTGEGEDKQASLLHMEETFPQQLCLSNDYLNVYLFTGMAAVLGLRYK